MVRILTKPTFYMVFGVLILGSFFSGYADTPTNNSKWALSLGLAPTWQPEYPGSNQYEWTATALYNLAYGNKFFVNPQGVGVNLITTPHVTFGTSVVYAKSNLYGEEFPGIDSSPYTYQETIFANYQLSLLTAGVSTNRTIGQLGGTGFYTSMLVLTLPLSQKFVCQMGVAGQYDDGRYMQVQFGVTPQETVNSGISTYQVNKGWDNISYAVNTFYSVTKNWTIVGIFQGIRYVDQVASSPLIQNKNTYTIEIGLIYNFDKVPFLR